jgi:hypothetical protein
MHSFALTGAAVTVTAVAMAAASLAVVIVRKIIGFLLPNKT